MFCPNCGTEAINNAKFCFNCGFNFADLGIGQANIGQNSSIKRNLDSSIPAVKQDTFKVAPAHCLAQYDMSYDLDRYINDQIILSHEFVFFDLLPSLLQTNLYLEKLYEDVNENTSDDEHAEKLKAAINYLLEINIYDFRKDVEFDVFKQISARCVGQINGQTQFIMSKIGLDEILTNLIIEDDAIINFANELYRIFNQSLSSSYSSLIASIQSLQSKKYLWKDVNDSKVSDTVLSLACNFAGGALAVANPLIGIPLLLGNFFRDKAKEKNTSNSVDSIIDDYKNTINLYDDVLTKLTLVRNEISETIANRLAQAIFQRNEIVKNYKNHEELLILYNELINDDANGIKGLVVQDGELSFIIDDLLEENISDRFRALLMA